MALPLDDAVRIGITSRLSAPRETRETVALAEDPGLDSLWLGGEEESRTQIERFVREIRPRLRPEARTPSVA